MVEVEDEADQLLKEILGTGESTSNLNAPAVAPPVEDADELRAQVLAAKREAVALKRQGQLQEARAALRRAKDLQARADAAAAAAAALPEAATAAARAPTTGAAQLNADSTLVPGEEAAPRFSSEDGAAQAALAAALSALSMPMDTPADVRGGGGRAGDAALLAELAALGGGEGGGEDGNEAVVEDPVASVPVAYVTSAATVSPPKAIVSAVTEESPEGFTVKATNWISASPSRPPKSLLPSMSSRKM